MIPPSNPEKPSPAPEPPRPPVDMSPEGIDRRLREVGMLWDFWNYLRRFKPTDITAPQPPEPNECRQSSAGHR